MSNYSFAREAKKHWEETIMALESVDSATARGYIYNAKIASERVSDDDDHLCPSAYLNEEEIGEYMRIIKQA